MKNWRFKIGDRVKVSEIPPPVVRDGAKFPETLDVFRCAVGRTFRIRDIDKHGHIELWLHKDGSEDETGCDQFIWVEAAYLAKAPIGTKGSEF
jgi:hypothetical protein